MVMSNQAMIKAAALLAAAQNDGTVIGSVPANLHPATLDEAYRIQFHIDTDRSKSAAGYKLGMGSDKGMRLTGEKGPLVGRIAHNRLWPSGATISIPSGAKAAAEVEIAVRVGSDGESFDAIFVALEIVCSRLVGGPAQGWPIFVADDSGCHAVVLGDMMPLKAKPPAASLLVDGKAVSQSATGEDGIAHAALFARFLAIARNHGLPVRPGMIVMTGSQIIPLPLSGRMDIQGMIGEAKVSATIVADQT